MDWQKWKKTILEASAYDSKTLQLARNEIIKSKQLLDNFISQNNQFVLFDLETSGLTEDYIKSSKAERQPEQILEIGCNVINLKLDNGKLSKEQIDGADYFVELKDFVKVRLDKDSEEYKKYVLHKINIAIQKLNLKDKIPLLTDYSQIQDLPEESEGFKFDKKNDEWIKKPITPNVRKTAEGAYKSAIDFDTARVLDMTKYYENSKDEPILSEKQALIKFLKFIKKYPNAVLAGQNISNFDLKFLDQRMRESNLGSLSQHNRLFFDTIDFARKVFHPALKQMEEYFSSKVKEIDAKLGEQSKIDEALLENEEIFSSIMSQGDDFVNSYPEEKRELAQLKFIFTILSTKAKQTKDELYNKATKRYTSSQGPLSKTFKIKTDKWHNALADVQMLADLFTAMYNFVDFAVKYVGGALSEEVLAEMEPYQRMVTQKHPAAKKRLTGHGKNKYKNGPYKVKLSYKRGKSAPPMG
jgi:DNA polymerase III epsilon subunit-like protein